LLFSVCIVFAADSFAQDRAAQLPDVPELQKPDVRVPGFGDADRTNVRMVPGRDGLRVAGKFLRQELQSDQATQLEVFRFVPHTMPPPPRLSAIR
jgi:hypothetical protein